MTFADKPTLQGTSVILRPFTLRDVEAMGAVLADPEVIRLTGSANSTADTLGRSSDLDEKTRDWYSSRAEQTDRLDLAVIDRATDECVGEVVLNDWSSDDESCNFRVLIGPRGRGRGLGTEATALLLDHAFSTLPLHRIELEVYAFNPRARHVYERSGFVVEGTRRDAFVFDDERIDAIVMSILRPEWDMRSHAPGASSPLS